MKRSFKLLLSSDIFPGVFMFVPSLVYINFGYTKGIVIMWGNKAVGVCVVNDGGLYG